MIVDCCGWLLMKCSLYVGAIVGLGDHMSETPILNVLDMEGRSPPRGSFLGPSRGMRVLEIGTSF